MYEVLVQPLVASVFAGTKVSCFAYGQTGSGKTYTMMGSSENNIPGIFSNLSRIVSLSRARCIFSYGNGRKRKFKCWSLFL